jgi:hypothetical protein
MKKRYLALALLPPALAAALAWYYDVYVNWKPNVFPLTMLAVSAGAAALTLLALWARGDRKATALLWKTTLSVAVFTGVSLVGVSTLINNVIGHNHMAKEAAAVALPLAAAQAVVLLVLLLRALDRKARRAIILVLGIAAALAAVAAGAVAGWNALRRVPQAQVAPASWELIAYDTETRIKSD